MTEKKDQIIKFKKAKAIAQYDYSSYAKYYDIIELKPHYIEYHNRVIDKLLSFYRVRTVHDISCGTGAQISYLLEKGYQVTGSDINQTMLDKAKEKLKDKKVSLRIGDMRSTRFGLFDAVISIFNSIGHLSRDDFELALSNVHQNLKKDGIFIFDNINYDFLLKGGLTGYDYIDTAFSIEDKIYVRFNNITLDEDSGIAHIVQKTYIQEMRKKPQVIVQDWDLQLYTSEELKKVLSRNGFNDVQILSGDGNSFDKDASETILVVAVLQDLKI